VGPQKAGEGPAAPPVLGASFPTAARTSPPMEVLPGTAQWQHFRRTLCREKIRGG
jgi:hypothetical protein